jgi:hypothetical protein
MSLRQRLTSGTSFLSEFANFEFDIQAANSRVGVDGLSALQRRDLVAQYLRLTGVEHAIGEEQQNLLLMVYFPHRSSLSLLFGPSILTCLVESLTNMSKSEFAALGLDYDPECASYPLHWNSLDDLFIYIAFLRDRGSV